MMGLPRAYDRTRLLLFGLERDDLASHGLAAVVLCGREQRSAAAFALECIFELAKRACLWECSRRASTSIR
jgi:hypothetical protein